MAYVNNAGVDLYYDVHGDGEPVVFIPGLGLTAEAWGSVTSLLAEQVRVIVLDPRGAGRSDKPDVPYTPLSLAQDLVSILDAAEVERGHVVGLSMGGMIAQELGIRFPDRVASLVLLSTYAAPDDWSRRLFEVRRLMIERLGLLDHFKLSIMLVFSPVAFREMGDQVEAVERRLRDNPPDTSAYLRQLQYCLDHDTTDRLNRISAPTVVVTGSNDILTSPLQGRDLAEGIPGAIYREFEGASHGLWVEKADAVADMIRDWVAGQRGSRHHSAR